MEPALQLAMKAERGEQVCAEMAKEALEKSPLFQQLLSPVADNTPLLLNRLTQLHEIPYAHLHPQVIAWRDTLAANTACNGGFSLDGTDHGLLACYNAMIATILIKLHYPDQQPITNAINWILRYQNTARGQPCQWEGKGILKYGGCMKATPCYIGVVKSMLALTAYQNCYTNSAHDEIAKKVEEGLEYILSHQVFKRRTDSQPITKYILKLTYPFTYKTNVVELLRLLKAHGLQNDSRCEAAKAYLMKKRHKAGHWQVHKVASPKGWVDFDLPGKPAHWLTFRIEQVLAS